MIQGWTIWEDCLHLIFLLLNFGSKPPRNLLCEGTIQIDQAINCWSLLELSLSRIALNCDGSFETWVLPTLQNHTHRHQGMVTLPQHSLQENKCHTELKLSLRDLTFQNWDVISSFRNESPYMSIDKSIFLLIPRRTSTNPHIAMEWSVNDVNILQVKRTKFIHKFNYNMVNFMFVWILESPN